MPNNNSYGFKQTTTKKLCISINNERMNEMKECNKNINLVLNEFTYSISRFCIIKSKKNCYAIFIYFFQCIYITLLKTNIILN